MKDIVNEHFPDVPFDYVEKRKGDVLCTKANMSQLKKLGFEPKINVKEGISNCFKQLKENLQ